jgi:hypothetical protein
VFFLQSLEMWQRSLQPRKISKLDRIFYSYQFGAFDNPYACFINWILNS